MGRLPKYMEQESTKRKANKREAKVYKHLVSGALEGFKGDFSTEDAIIEQKSTIKKSISVTEKICEKLIEDSITMGKSKSVLLLDLPNYYLVCTLQKKPTKD